MKRARRDLRISTLSHVVAALAAAALLASVVSGLAIERAAKQGRAHWAAFEDGVNQKAIHLAAIRSALGYDGVFHHYKNFVLDRDPLTIIAVQDRLLGLSVALTAYGAAGPNAAEAAALAEIAAVGDAFTDAVATAERLSLVEISPELLNEMAAVDDRPLIGALDQLESELERGLARRTQAVFAAFERVSTTTRFASVGAVLVLLALIATDRWLVRRRILGRLARLAATMRALAGGRLDVVVDGVRDTDEIGDMARAVAVFHQHEVELANVGRRLEAEIGAVVDALTQSAGHLDQRARTLSCLMRETEGGGADVALRCAQLTQAAKVVASGSDQLVRSIGEVAETVENSRQAAQQSSDEATRANATMDAMVARASEIGAVVALITEIAERTNLLALNATIEAARAGDAGKGFAVVAQEVKDLARQTGEAAGKVASEVEALQAATGQVARQVSEIDGATGAIAQASGAVVGAIDEQRQATAEIAAQSEQSAGGAAAVDQAFRDIVEHTKSANDESLALTRLSAELLSHAERLRANMEDLVAGAA